MKYVISAWVESLSILEMLLKNCTTADLIKFTTEILIWKLFFFFAVKDQLSAFRQWRSFGFSCPETQIKNQCKIHSIVHYVCYFWKLKITIACIYLTCFINFSAYFKTLMYVLTKVRKDFVEPTTHSLFFLKFC